MRGLLIGSLSMHMCTDDLFYFFQDFRPRIYVSASDFATITLEGKLCNSAGKLGTEQFETVFRRMLTLYTQRQVRDSVHSDST
jgi:hypothetical protein